MPVYPVGGRPRPSKAVWETRSVGAAARLDGPRVFHSAGRMHRPTGGGLECGEKGRETIWCRFRVVRDWLLEARGFRFKIGEPQRGPWAEALQ